MTKGRGALRGRVVAEQEPFTLLREKTTLSFVISTGAQRSGEISVWMLYPGKPFASTR
jgi:hypothetical protein